MIRVLVADDQVLVRDGLRAIIDREADLTVVGEAGDGAAAVEAVRRLRPHVVLMDVRMPHLDGLQATRTLMAQPDPPSIIVLTTFDRDEWVYEAMRAGATGFLLKDARSGQLLEAIRSAASGGLLLAPAITRRLVEEHLARGDRATRDPRVAELSDRETEVLRLIAAGLSNDEIAARLFLGVSTVKTYVNRLLTKLALRDRTQAAVFAHQNGLATEADPRP